MGGGDLGGTPHRAVPMDPSLAICCPMRARCPARLGPLSREVPRAQQSLLTQAAVHSRTDVVSGVSECIIMGIPIPLGDCLPQPAVHQLLPSIITCHPARSSRACREVATLFDWRPHSPLQVRDFSSSCSAYPGSPCPQRSPCSSPPWRNMSDSQGRVRTKSEFT